MLALCHTALPQILSLPPHTPNPVFWEAHPDGLLRLGLPVGVAHGGIRGAWREGGRRGLLEGSAAPDPTSAPSAALPLQGRPLHHFRPKMVTAPGVRTRGYRVIPCGFS